MMNRRFCCKYNNSKICLHALIEISIIFTLYSDRSLLLGSGSLSLNSVFPTEMGNNFKTTDDFAEIYTSCVHKLTSLP